jgi:hypothetical protein
MPFFAPARPGLAAIALNPRFPLDRLDNAVHFTVLRNMNIRS